MLVTFASIAAATDRARRAVRLGGAPTRLANALAVSIVPDHRVALDAALAAARAELGEAEFATAWREGQAMTTDQAVAYALVEDTAAKPADDNLLSPRELEVVRLVAHGLTNRLLPDAMYLSGPGGTPPNIENMAEFLKAKCADLTPYLSGDAIKDYPNLANIPTSAWRVPIYGNAIYGIPNMIANG